MDEKLVVARQSAFQALRLTEDRRGLRTLRFGADGASQSVVKLGYPRHLELAYTRLLPAGFAFRPDPLRILVVGLGGGTLPMFFHSHFPEATVDVVELDPDVVALAKEYCGFKEDARMRVQVEDARDFIHATRERYDVIILDGFGTECIPAHLTTTEFLKEVRSSLTSEGIVIANIWGRATNSLYGSMLLTYRDAFEDLYIFDVPGPGTKLFIGLSDRRVVTRDEVLKAAEDLAQSRGFEYNLSGCITGFRNAMAETVRGGCILKD